MTLVDAALSILRSQPRPMTAEALAEAAVAAKHVAKVSPAQLRALTEKLDALAEAGDEVERVGTGYINPGAGKAAKTNKPAKGKPAVKAPAKAAAKSAAKPAAKAPAAAKPNKAKPSKAAGPAASAVESVAPSAPVLTPEEEALAAVYGDELESPPPVLGEYRDAQTADEDRAMLPEISARAERQKQWDDRRPNWKDRREQRKREREQRRAERGGEPAGGTRPAAPNGAGPERAPDGGAPRHGQGGPRGPQHGGGSRPNAQVPMTPQPSQPSGPSGPAQPMAMPAATGLAGAAPHGTASLGLSRDGAVAADLLRGQRNTQPVPTRQLAAMMRKRGAVAWEPEQAWPSLKIELLSDERAARRLGVRAPISHRGRDLVAASVASQAATYDAELAVGAAVHALAQVVRQALAVRVGAASPIAFERLVHLYLHAAGYRQIAWVKRVGEISYATCTAPSGATILVSARSGNDAVERRGVGELRVGVEAKGYTYGLLIAARDLGPDALRELERPSRNIAVLCGEAFLDALLALGLGVTTTYAPVTVLDDDLFGELASQG